MRHLFLLLAFYASSAYSQGTTCDNAVQLIFDSVCRNIPASGATGAALNCNVTGNQSNVTWLKITTGNPAKCPRLNIKTIPAIPFEIVVYSSCNGSSSQYLYPQSLCSMDGDATWSPDSYNPLAANTTYYIRIRTQGSFSGGVFNVCASWETQTNDECATAMPLDPTYQHDNNCCNTQSPTTVAGSICAHTIENDAFYSYTIAMNGNSIINIMNIDCDNAYASSGSDGFQIGFFTGTCGNLQQMPPCTTGLANGSGFVQFTSPYFTAGTKVYVIIDGISGANCEYDIMATNSIPLPYYPRQPRPQLPPLLDLVNKTINPRTQTQVLIYDATGRLLYQNKISTPTKIPPYPSAIYFIQIGNEKHKVWLPNY